MTNLAQSQIFFFISSIGFIILGILIALVLVYFLHLLNLSSKILKKIEKDIDSIGDTTRETLDEMRDSNVFRFTFGDKHKKRNHK